MYTAGEQPQPLLVMAAFPPVHTWQALPEMWPYLAATHGTLIAVEEPHRKPAVTCTYTQLAQDIRQFAAGLSHLGLNPGEHIALFADNSSRWLVADQGTMLAGLVNVVRGTQAPPAELDYIYRHSESVALIAEDQATLRTLQPYLKDWSLRAIILLFGDELDTVLEVPAPVLILEQVMRMGETATWTPPTLGRADLATLLYTSGTTGRPKGVMLSHGNLLHQVENLHVVLTPQPGYVALSLLPTWHTYERSSEYYLFSRGIRQVYTNLRSFKQDLKRYQPHHIVGVPRLWESIYEGIERELRQQPAGRQKLINFLLSQSRRHILARRQWQGTALAPGSRLPAGVQLLLTWPFQALADRLIYGKVRQAVGGRLCEGASGGGALSRHLDDFYEMAGVAIVVGYGLTETSPVLTARRVKPNIRYTAGRPIPGTEIRIVDPETRQTLPTGQKGLVLARGPQIMLGYYRNPEATAKVLDPEGWFDTGDLGWLTPRQDLVLTGRAKDTIVLTSGENIEPQPI
ncbi:MAG: AMP-binding protein, partial [Gloeomargaritaceae cyanobacterium C42_A2020_066]|nr:AMP-binding protein [Gloeomargaritaceae cyanobacterium C42_A2020_066]